MEESIEHVEFVELCLRGQSLLLPSSDIMKHDWLVRKMLTTDLPSRRTSNGALYLDLDATSFHTVYQILSGVLILDDETLCQLDRLSLKTAADYMGCTSFRHQIEEYEASLKKDSDAQQARIRDLEAENAKLKTQLESGASLKKDSDAQQARIRDLEAENAKLKTQLESGIEHLILGGGCAEADVRIFTCSEYRTHRSSNRCGNRAVFIGCDDRDDWDVTVKCPCGGIIEGGKGRSNLAYRLTDSLVCLLSTA